MNNAAAEVERIVGEIDRLPDLSRTSIERLFDVTLAPSPRAPGDPRYLQASLSNGPFEAVVLFTPAADHPDVDVSLGLEVRRGMAIHEGNFARTFLGEVVDMNPNIPPEGTRAYGFTTSRGRRVLEFWARRNELRLLNVSRRQTPH